MSKKGRVDAVAAESETDAAVDTTPKRVRPLAITLGSLLMLARAVAGFTFVAVSANTLTDIVVSIVHELLREEPSAIESTELTQFISVILTAALTAYLIWHMIYFFLMVAVFRGSEVARIIAMSFATISIALTFAATVSGGETISLRNTSLLSLALDILILLALSGHDARVFSRWGRSRDA